MEVKFSNPLSNQHFITISPSSLFPFFTIISTPLSTHIPFQPVKLNDTVFAVHPKTWCEHLEGHVNSAPATLEKSPACQTCGDSSESWYCLSCYQVSVARRPDHKIFAPSNLLTILYRSFSSRYNSVNDIINPN